ncbi:site-specific integrase [Variovorax sp. OV084]|uniref:site-specific integrase n=1 Tax=Variovorax sp. OV084 TaxID=1882777 RepID=UPI0008B18DEE|nr:site-specific integrase [Variovorax sp. OV084]SET01971.1 Site-specific recombinase XerD [Variovorax sp. OV084]
MASKIPGLFQRGGMWWLRVIAPLDLQAPFYGGKRIAFNGSLGTSDPQVARVSAAAKRADLEAQFLRQRRELSPPKLASIAPEVRSLIVGTLLEAEASEDAAQRLHKDATTRFYSPATAVYQLEDGSLPARPEAPPVGSLRPLAPSTVAARAAFNLRRREVVRAALASGNLEVVILLVQPIVKRLGLAIDYETADGVQLLHECLAAYSSAREIAVQRDQGLVVPTPPKPASSPETAQMTPNASGMVEAAAHLKDIKADWLAIKARARPAIKITDRALNLLAEAGVDVPLSELDRTHGAKLRAHLVATGIKGQSVKNLIAPLQALLNVAVDAGKLKANPWAGLKIDTSDSTTRLPWRTEDLKKLVETNNARSDAGRWLLPLGLYTSARIGELAQLELTDIKQIDGVWCIEVHDRRTEGHQNRTVKTKAGERLIPIHQHLIDLRFLEFVESARKAGGRFVFPKFVQRGKRRPGDLAGLDFLKLREGAGVELDERFTFHSLRHNGRSMLAAAGINEQIIDKLVGHESGTVQGRYTHADTATLAAAVAKLDWTTLGLR